MVVYLGTNLGNIKKLIFKYKKIFQHKFNLTFQINYYKILFIFQKINIINNDIVNLKINYHIKRIL